VKSIVCLVSGALLIGAGAPAVAQQEASSGSSANAPTTKGTPVDPASLAVAHQILTIAFPPEKRVQIFGSHIDLIVREARKSMQNLEFSKDKDFQAIVDHSTQRMFDELKSSLEGALPDYFESMEHAYARTFSADDLNAILAFVKTPAGQHYFERAPFLLKDPDVEAATQRMMTQLAAKLPEITRENKQDVADYLARKAKEEKGAKPTA
jgi:hypothetical protein